MPLVNWVGSVWPMSAVNKPTCLAMRFKAPIREGTYHVDPAFYHPEKGPYVLGLSPFGNGRHQ